ncbi:hypothetical protein HOLleu_34339 [Holothuria leucospilota]|uniref:Uncharacterized protein n=1 Tax=Holothuria leucospilota TaxID=206669 RepID=A0A9Q0YQE4_HOLLE|nr:hypothetical protein HOLleu_34339 [Holothuria leucospilota]
MTSGGSSSHRLRELFQELTGRMILLRHECFYRGFSAGTIRDLLSEGIRLEIVLCTTNSYKGNND